MVHTSYTEQIEVLHTNVHAVSSVHPLINLHMVLHGIYQGHQLRVKHAWSECHPQIASVS